MKAAWPQAKNTVFYVPFGPEDPPILHEVFVTFENNVSSGRVGALLP